MSDGRHIFTHSDVLLSVYSTVFIYGTFILFYFIFIKFLTKSSKMYKRKFYAVHTSHVRFNISSKKCISWNTNSCMFWHLSGILRESLKQTCLSQNNRNITLPVRISAEVEYYVVLKCNSISIQFNSIYFTFQWSITWLQTNMDVEIVRKYIYIYKATNTC